MKHDEYPRNGPEPAPLFGTYIDFITGCSTIYGDVFVIREHIETDHHL
jgi:hypothetical protein